MSKYKYISFFSGALGLDLGLEESGMECLAVNEIEPIFCETIKANKPKIKLYDCDIRLLSPERLMSDLKIKKGELFLIAGGPPCQAFSTAGKRLSLDDDRGNVFLTYLDIIIGLEPQYFILENVRGLLSAQIEHVPHVLRDENYDEFLKQHQKGGVLYLAINKLEEAGYNINFDLYDTSSYGVPQKRERVVMIGTKNPNKVPLIPETHSNDKSKNLPAIRVFKDVCSDIVNHNHIEFEKKRLKFLAKVPEGGNWKSLPIEDRKEAMGGSFDSGGGKTGFYRRLHRDQPTPTLVTSPRMPATMLCHPTELRPISIQEYSAIQTFPNNFIFKGKIEDVYRQIGNAVPVAFSKTIGEHIIKHANGTLDKNQKYSSTTRYKNTNYDDFLAWFKKSNNI